ncbi:MAG: hypothetical protein CL521_04515 [Actinobacteria bacterium]|nr:hypothetical protein [Actinomycetota bacterium]
MSSILLAKFLGIFLTVLGLGTILNHQHLTSAVDEITKSKALGLVSGIVPLLLGSILVSTHHVLVSGLPMIITIIGYVFLISGIIRIMFPDIWVKLIRNNKEVLPLSLVGLLMTLLGFVLIYFGFLV